MLSIFPELLSLGLLAPFFLRVAVGFIFLRNGWRHAKIARTSPLESTVESNETPAAPTFQHHWGPFGTFLLWYLVILEAVAGVLLILGLLTQLAALGGMFLIIAYLRLHKHYPKLAPYSTTLYLLVLIICFSLLFLGAGRPAFDLPL